MEFKFSDAIIINPREKMKKGELIKKISMQNIKERNRNILDYEIAPYSSGSKFRNKDTLFARITPCLENGKTAQVNILNDDEIAFGSTEFIIFRAKPGITIPDYVYFLSISEFIRQQAIKSMTGTSGRQRVQNSIFDEITIEVPSIEEQEKIVGILNSLDSKIEINNKIISNLESQAQAIFKSWFVDFEPFQDGNFVESELGMIPEGWEVKALGELYPMKSGYAFKSKDWSDNGFPIIKIKNISNGSIDLSNCDYVNCNETLKKAISFKVTGGEIVIALTGATTGKFGVIPYNTSAYINQRAGLFFDKQEIGYGFLYGLLNQKKIINNIIELSRGSAQANLSPRDVNSLKFAFDKNISDIFNLLNYYIKKVSELKFQNTKLAELRDAVLPKLMAGEIDVSNIKIEGEEVKNE